MVGSDSGLGSLLVNATKIYFKYENCISRTDFYFFSYKTGKKENKSIKFQFLIFARICDLDSGCRQTTQNMAILIISLSFLEVII